MAFRAVAQRIEADPPIAASERVLPNRDELACIAVERTRMPMLVIDPVRLDRPVLLANRAFLKLTGFTADEVLGGSFDLLYGPATDHNAIHTIAAAMATGQEATVELIGYRKDGDTFWAQAFFSPILADDGSLLYYFASYLDVSKRRQAETLEAAEHRLLLEVDHRAKNALALVQAIVRLSRMDDPAHYAQAVQGRVDALAGAHALLADRKWKAIPVGHVVEAETRRFGSGRIELRPESESCLAATQVQPVALVLHELLSNAEQHGALSCPTGRVSIGWRDMQAGVWIDCVEAGGPCLPLDRAPGFGMALIETTVRRQLRGTSQFNWHPDGLQVSLHIPAARTDASRESFRLRQ